mgnify:CR=1 FL=1
MVKYVHQIQKQCMVIHNILCIRKFGWDRALEFPRDYDGACLQMRLSYSRAARFFLFLVRWTDCSLAGALGLLRILICKVYVNILNTFHKSILAYMFVIIFYSILFIK